MSDALFQVQTTHQGDQTQVKLSGVINEEAELLFFSSLKPGKVVINTKEINRINSCGVREWITAMKKMPAGIELVYEECSPAFMDQVNMITNFVGKGAIKSLYLPYENPSNGYKCEVLCDLEVCMTDDGLELPEATDPETGEALELADDPDQLFSFLE